MKKLSVQALAYAFAAAMLAVAVWLALFKPATCAVLLAAWATFSILPNLKLWLITSAGAVIDANKARSRREAITG